jgi:S1-C subfamily serine protease
MIEWRHLLPILMHVKGKPLHLGISAQAMENQEGVSVVRIAPNSPFKHDIMMGDLIVSANGHQFSDPESLHRICVESNGDVELVIQREGRRVEVKIHL